MLRDSFIVRVVVVFGEVKFKGKPENFAEHFLVFFSLNRQFRSSLLPLSLLCHHSFSHLTFFLPARNRVVKNSQTEIKQSDLREFVTFLLESGCEGARQSDGFH